MTIKKKTAKKKAAVKKTPAKKTAAKKAATKKPAVKKAVAKKPAAKSKSAASNKEAAAPKSKPAAKKKKSSSRGVSVGSASTASILGFTPLKKAKGGNKRPENFDHIKPAWVKYYQRLLDLRGRLTTQMSGLAKESAETMASYSLHMADSGTDNFDRDFALGLLSSDQDALYEIDEALKRIEKDVYGVCEITGKAIPKARLNAIPWTRFTVEAQAQLEKDGALHSKRLGKIGSVGGSSGSVEIDDDSDDEIKSKK